MTGSGRLLFGIARGHYGKENPFQKFDGQAVCSSETLILPLNIRDAVT